MESYSADPFRQRDLVFPTYGSFTLDRICSYKTSHFDRTCSLVEVIKMNDDSPFFAKRYFWSISPSSCLCLNVTSEAAKPPNSVLRSCS